MSNKVKTVLIANRGAIACRVIRTLKKMGIRSVAIYHHLDSHSLHVQQADVAICLGDGSVNETYLDIDKIISIAQQENVDAIHPGYGFLSENINFVTACEQHDLVFIGPTPDHISLFGLKHKAREVAEQNNVPLIVGSEILTCVEQAIQIANEISYPVMLKSTAGGGGIGMQVCHSDAALADAWLTVKRQSMNNFANDGVFIEKFIAHARHIEVQVFGDGLGQVVSLGERDCSAQRRNQKVIEETPAPNLSNAVRNQLCATAEQLMKAINYRNAGTVEFIYDDDTSEFYFLEVNTRLQVEHGVTEQVWGVDLVQWMVSLAAGELTDLGQLKSRLTPQGHAIQARVYAEDPQQDFLPCAGLLSKVTWPQLDQSTEPPTVNPPLRIEHWIETGIEVPALFDPMLAKVIVTADSRQQALNALNQALTDTVLYGIETNRDYLVAILSNDLCQAGKLLTNSLEKISAASNTFQVMQAGTQTTVQDYPARSDLWHVGVPPSGPMDNLNFRLANRLLNNSPDCAGLEITLNGPTLKFHTDTCIAITGTRINAAINDQVIACYEVVSVKAGDVLSLGKVEGSGARSYLAIAGGINCPEYLGSKSTFILGQFGGHNGRALRVGDVLHINEVDKNLAKPTTKITSQPATPDVRSLRVIYGPHGAPDFFTDDDITQFFEHTWQVHYNSDRTGIRLIGPKPTWARATGGEAGMHPSNIHDNAYAFGTIDFTGDMPVILGPDGPSLGGFVCPATVIHADLWKLGQLKAGDSVRFQPVTHADAVAITKQQLNDIEQLAISDEAHESPIDQTLLANTAPIVYQGILAGDELVCRLAGDNFVLIEVGPLELNIARRFKVHALMLWLQEQSIEGMQELTPGVRSLQVHYDPLTLGLDALLSLLQRACDDLTSMDELTVPSRIVYLPLSWDDVVCQQAIEKYAQSVREQAPWIPSNLEFIRRINGLSDIQAVKDIIFDATYLVMGLGDVYLGAPLTTPVDPRHRLVTTKYNPARTWTAENSVGIGGAYMCVYGMEGPGGYQLFGRTLQMWSRYKKTNVFTEPWLLRFFDQIRFYPVSAEELVDIREQFTQGDYPLKIEETEFNLSDYAAFLAQNEADIDTFETKRQTAFDAELANWHLEGQFDFESDVDVMPATEQEVVPEGEVSVDSPVSGSIWKVLVEQGQHIKRGDTLMVLEAMKTEIEIIADQDGEVTRIFKQQSQMLSAGESLMWVKPND